MAKLYNLQQNLSKINLFLPHQDAQLYLKEFYSTDLGKIYQSIPWDNLVKLFAKRKCKNGKKPIFTTQGKLALMFLKSYTQCSDSKLIERLNTDYSLQFFCNIYLFPGRRIKDYKIVSKIRCELAGKLDIRRTQKVLADAWKPYLKDTHVLLEDATCYETDMRYPTDVKLLWESSQWIYKEMKLICKYARRRMPRSKYPEQQERYLHYQRNRKKGYKKTQRKIKSLLYLLNKLLDQLNEIEQQESGKFSFPDRYYQRKQTIEKILIQQRQMYDTKNNIPGRIVSISKSYIRPIVRGKETKRVEFGAKVNMIQIDGINFIEHLSFSAFHEGIRLPQSVWLALDLFGKCTHVSADNIYATNVNRKFCSERNMYTNFIRKGRASKDEEQRQQLRSVLSKERATRMEGSFGVEKNHYGLSRIKARIKPTEILWIFFGVHTANAVKMARKKYPEKIPRQVA